MADKFLRVNPTIEQVLEYEGCDVFYIRKPDHHYGQYECAVNIPAYTRVAGYKVMFNDVIKKDIVYADLTNDYATWVDEVVGKSHGSVDAAGVRKMLADTIWKQVQNRHGLSKMCIATRVMHEYRVSEDPYYFWMDVNERQKVIDELWERYNAA